MEIAEAIDKLYADLLCEWLSNQTWLGGGLDVDLQKKQLIVSIVLILSFYHVDLDIFALFAHTLCQFVAKDFVLFCFAHSKRAKDHSKRHDVAHEFEGGKLDF